MSATAITIDASVVNVKAGTSPLDSQDQALPESMLSHYKAFVDRAVDVFGDETKASRWLSLPNSDLDGQIPLQIAQSAQYDQAKMNRIFEPLFIRIEHGTYT